MAQPFTLKLGAQDLSDYLRVAPGEGFDPADSSGFLEPQFGVSPFAEGQPVLNVDVQNKELSWPLFLKAASRDGLNTLITNINNEIATNPHLLVEWKDTGTTNSTFFDVGFARLDVDYSYRVAGKNYTKATLHIYCTPPYGHTGTTRPLASIAASGIVVIVPIPAASPILGDAPPLLDVFVRAGGSGYYPQSGRVAGWAPLPHPSYAGYIPAGSLTSISNATLWGASGAQASRLMVAGRVSDVRDVRGRAYAYLSPASVYAGGRHRILAVARTSDSAGMAIRALDQGGVPIAPTSLATTVKDWSIVDLGAFSVPTDVAMATIPIGIQWGQIDDNTIATGMMMPVMPVTLPNPHTTASGWGGINALIVVPDDRLRMVADSPRLLVAALTNPVGVPSGFSASGAYDLTGNQWVCPTYVAATAFYSRALTTLGGLSNFSASGVGLMGVHAPVENLRVVTFSDFTASGVILSIRKQFDIQGAYYAGLVAADHLSITYFDGAATTLIASAAASIPVQNEYIRAEFGNQGGALHVSMDPIDNPGFGQMASLGATPTSPVSLPPDRPGRAAIRSESAKLLVVSGVLVESLPPSVLGSRDGYEFTDRQTIQRQTSATVFNGDVTGMGRGAGLPPATGSKVAAILAFACNLEGGSGTDLLDVGVSVRERFQFAR